MTENILKSLKISSVLAASVVLVSACSQNDSIYNSSSIPPIQASNVGYVLNTFHTGPFSTSNVDKNQTYSSGYDWYQFNCYGTSPTFANNVIHPDGTITIGQGGNTYNANLSSAACKGTAPGYVGTAFGGGLYVEASLKFTADAGDFAEGWPSWWTSPIEAIADLPGKYWGGSEPADYVHAFEGDIIEYFLGDFSDSLTTFQSTNHDWYGNTGYATSYTWQVSSTAFFSSSHKYGMLWVPATASTDGYVSYYLDGSSYFTQIYSKYSPSFVPPPSATTSWAFGVLDLQHLVLILGSASTNPITVSTVDVWQATNANNLSN